jgi:multiple sugar transport system permease protein
MKQIMDDSHNRRGSSLGKKVTKAVTYGFLGFWALVVLFPFYWMVLTSVKDYGDYNAEFIPQFVTLSPTLENYISAFSLYKHSAFCAYIKRTGAGRKRKKHKKAQNCR